MVNRFLIAACLAVVTPQIGEMKIGGDVSPSTGQPVQCDLPQSLRIRNVGGRDGSGLCVFTSINHSALWANEALLKDFQSKMRQELGGGWPSKVDIMLKKYAPRARYIQHTGGDMEFLRQALKSGRMPSVTYDGRDPFYRGQKVAHMVNLVYLSDTEAAILDNNNPTKLMWMSAAEFESRWKGANGKDGWAIVLLNPCPPPAPRN